MEGGKKIMGIAERLGNRLRGLKDLFGINGVGKNGAANHVVLMRKERVSFVSLQEVPLQEDIPKPDDLETSLGNVRDAAYELGLDPFDTLCKKVPVELIHRYNASGAPGRYFHWIQQLRYARLKESHLEHVTNTDPSYVYIPEGEKITVSAWRYARALAQADFYKHNKAFAKTDRNTGLIFQEYASRIREYGVNFGAKEVQAVLDGAYSIQWFIDPSDPNKSSPGDYKKASDQKHRDSIRLKPEKKTPYDDLPKIPESVQKLREIDSQIAEVKPYLEDPEAKQLATVFLQELEAKKRALLSPPVKPKEKNPPPFPSKPEQDILWFIAAFSPVLKDWQRDVLTMVRAEALYFYPIMQTAILLEGWKTFVARNIMRNLERSGKIKPNGEWEKEYELLANKLGIALFDDILGKFDPESEDVIRREIREKDYRGRFIDPKSFIGKIEYDPLYVRENVSSDWGFLNSYLTPKIVEELGIAAISGSTTNRDYNTVKKALVDSVENNGLPLIQVAENGGDWNSNRELYLVHTFDGRELDEEATRKALKAVAMVWGRKVHLESKKGNNEQKIISVPS
ncbi:MAG: hypothetical protein A3D75_02560 [Candidatus Levybacteria bacterium RIFCSPHIGHO2_02_FULL_37_18]|nr:MAG: hypothetical protein A2770_03615 [Candidatus Levybacteria bacterium RIFCSPHIGHO2_01_FULL_38_12]OGH22105.1 MAG: hypothetical protein A3D75_02560 [Candidatus Levybacteria bacterium RIFCSPHIGHO2_02_FULL_37_18]OGH44916.1 MAG: hypothetical protein A3J14_00985 [Candidatus Levybacteria bacterium RIFCSPLOWO2_02_FULL_37_18]